MMAGGIKSRRTLSLLILLIFLSLTELLEVKDEWQDLRPDTAGLHRLRGLSEHMLHEGLPSDQRVGIGQSVQGHWQQCEEGFTSCGTQQEQHEQKISASEISHSYSQTLLVMADKEKPAEDRVQQESSVDPHYSVRVSTECLFNGSCGPEADQYDHQQILIMQDDPTVRRAAASLYEKRPAVTSVYALDEHQRPRLVHGAPVPLSEDSRLTLVGHGERDGSGETRLAGYTARDVARIIQHTFRTGHRIRTTSVVACEVGSDEEFAEALLRELHETAHIETELHLRSAVLQVRHTGEIITQEISEEGLQWRQNDDSKKVVATLDRNGDVVIRNEPGSRGEQVFTHERNFLMPPKKNQPEQSGSKGKGETSSTEVAKKYGWPTEPDRFTDQSVFNTFTDAKTAKTAKTAINELEALSWAFFHVDLEKKDPPQKVNTVIQDIQIYVIGKKGITEHKGIKEKEKKTNYLQVNDYLKQKIEKNDQLEGIQWITDQNERNNVLSECYVINTARDVRSIIRHYAKDGEDKLTHLMVRDWIFVVHPVSLYVYPVGKRLDQNQGDKEDKVKKVIAEQTDEVRYEQLRVDQTNGSFKDKKKRYADYVSDIFLGQETSLTLQELKHVTYFTASVIAESARNFRTFPLILMAVEMVENGREIGEDFLYEEHPMARGGSWINTPLRGFRGSATPKDPSTSTAYSSQSQASPSPEPKLKLEEVIEREVNLYNSWIETIDGKVLDDKKVREMADKFQLAEGDPVKKYKYFKDEMNKKSGASSSGR